MYRVRISNSGGFVDSDGVAVAFVGALRWGVPSLVSDSLRLPFNGIPGRRYAIEAASSPGSPFRLIGELPGQPDCSFDLESLSDSGRFYRIRPLP
ncbi:MAG: hypothetical protein EBU81_06115 [Proteobacteria bacterium]|nr:hypothetical protein [Pseudomonadota bacterium]